MRSEFRDIYKDMLTGWSLVKTDLGLQFINSGRTVSMSWIDSQVAYIFITYYLDPKQRDGF
jgi:hypothetical protein